MDVDMSKNLLKTMTIERKGYGFFFFFVKFIHKNLLDFFSNCSTMGHSIKHADVSQVTRKNNPDALKLYNKNTIKRVRTPPIA